MTSRRAGSITRRGARKWLVRIFEGIEGADGRRRYRSKTVHGTKRDADTALQRMLTERDLGLHGGRETLGEYLDRWLAESAAPRIAPRTLEGYRASLDKWVRPALGARRLDQLRPLDIQGLYTRIHETASAHAVVHTHRPLSAALRQAVRWRMLPSNPAEGVRLPREPRREMCALTAPQAAALQRELSTRRRGLVFVFALATGMRPGEIQALRWADLDFEHGAASVRQSLVLLKGGAWEFGEPKTKLSRRTIPLPAQLVTALRRHRAAQAEHRLQLGDAYLDLDLVFASETGGPLDAQNLAQRVLKKALKAAGLPDRFRFYDCRHTCATLLLQAGENPKVVSERLGHSTIAFTLERYGHVLPGMQERASERLGSILFGE